jgi:hypothetical protein
MIFKSDPQSALSKAQEKIASIEANLAQLQTSRAAKLVTAEDAAEVLTVDRAIEAERVNLTIYRDRVKALQEKCRKAEFRSREERRAKAISKIKERLNRREELAVQLQKTSDSRRPRASSQQPGRTIAQGQTKWRRIVCQTVRLSSDAKPPPGRGNFHSISISPGVVSCV